MPDTLTLTPDWKATRKLTAESRQTLLGDGYQQMAAGGIHAIGETWEVSKTGLTDAETEVLLGRFAQWGGVDPFYWSPYDSSDPELRRLYYCKSWSRTPLGPNCWQFRATFIRDFSMGIAVSNGAGVDGGGY